MAELWKLEAEVGGQSPEARTVARQAVSAPLVTELFTLWKQTLPHISGRSKLAEVLRYALTRREIFDRFLTDGRIELDSNIVERAIRPQAIGRKNSLFVGHEAGAQNWAVLASLIETCKLNGMEPHSYRTQTLTAIVNGYRQSQINELLP